MNVKLRKINEEDLTLIMQWRMDPDISKYMNTNPQLTLDGQKKWLSSIRSRDDQRYWLIETDGAPAGIINLTDIDWTAQTSSWGYYIGERRLRSLQLAVSLEMSLYDYVFDALELQELHSEIFSLNKGVITLHLACGSHITHEIKGEVEKEGVLYDVTHMSITRNEWNKIRANKKYDKIDYDIYP